jgi:hypothetical protein
LWGRWQVIVEKNNAQLLSDFKKSRQKDVADIYFLFGSMLIVPIIIIALQFRGVYGKYFMITGATLWAILLIILVAVDISTKYSRKQPYISEYK